MCVCVSVYSGCRCGTKASCPTLLTLPLKLTVQMFQLPSSVNVLVKSVKKVAESCQNVWNGSFFG